MIFGRTARVNFLVEFINQSVSYKFYNITYEIVTRFMSDLLKAKYLPIFDRLFQQFQDDTSRYEAKLVLMLKSMPLMNK